MYKVIRTVGPSSPLTQQKILSKGSEMNPFNPEARLSSGVNGTEPPPATRHPLKRVKAAPTIDGEPERTQQTTSGNDGNE